jgi:hypothetical protein
VKITRLYTGRDNESHFEEADIPLLDAGLIGRLSETLAATGIIFRQTGADYEYGWHPAPQRQFVIMLEGEVDIEVGDGTIRRLGPGDILLAEDTAGRGHCSRAVDGRPRKSVFVTLD